MIISTVRNHPRFKLNLCRLALSLLLLSLWPRPALAQDEAGMAVFHAINQARAENGLAPLALNPLLNQAAQNHVNDMISNYVYGHYGSDGSSVHTRVARTGYSATPWVSENWVSASNASGAMRWWMGDYIHRVNILTAHWAEVGVGVGSRGSEKIFVTVFSAGGGSSSETAAIAAGTPPQESPPPPSVHIAQLTVPAEGMDYTVKGGDTLLAIGLRYGLPWERIAEANGLDERSLLQIGQIVRIPGSGTPAGPPPPEVETEDYTVQPNDTLFSIAARRGLYWDDVAVVNGFGEHTVLQIGQVIRVPVVEEAVVEAESVEVETPVQANSFVASSQKVVGPVAPDEKVVDFNDYTLMQINNGGSGQASHVATATAYTGVGGPTTDVVQVAMAESNGAGATSVVLAAYAQREAETLYVVEPGDTIISIAVKHNLEWGPLLALNGLGEDSVLQPGQTIRLR